jgi:hypothetical protein
MEATMATNKPKRTATVKVVDKLMADNKWRTEESIYKTLLASYVEEAKTRAQAAVKEWLKFHLDSFEDFGLRMKDAGARKDLTRYTYWRIAPSEQWFVSRLGSPDEVSDEEAQRRSLELARRELAEAEAKERKREARQRAARKQRDEAQRNEVQSSQ